MNVVQTFMIKDIYGNIIFSPGGYWLYLEVALVFSGYIFKNSATHEILSNFNFFMLKLKTDNYGGENLRNLNNNGYIVLSKRQYTYHSKEPYEETLLIISDFRTFSIKDPWGYVIFCRHGTGIVSDNWSGLNEYKVLEVIVMIKDYRFQLGSK